jgi:hypothetical protein
MIGWRVRVPSAAHRRDLRHAMSCSIKNRNSIGNRKENHAMKKTTTTRQRLAYSTAGAAALALLATAGISSSASAAVDPHGANARFISVGKSGECATLGYKAVGYMVDSAGKKIPNSTWHEWDGTLRGCLKSVAVFAWEPANYHAEITISVSGPDRKVMITRTFRGDTNLCLMDDHGTWKENRSTVGGGGNGNCTAKA